MGPFTLRLDRSASPFESLLESILYQQLHGKAAATIHRRVREYFGGDPTPQLLLDTPDDPLRAAGVSGNKIKALRDLAARTLDGTVPTHAAIRKMSDADIVERLTEVRGIGSWTVEMLLIFRLGRPDVLPVTDYGVRKGYALTFQRVPKSRPLEAADLPKPDVLFAAASAGRRTVPWPVGTCGGPAIWPKNTAPAGRSARIDSRRIGRTIASAARIRSSQRPPSESSCHQSSVLFAFTATFISRPAKIPGWRRWKRRTRPLPTTTGTSASAPSATRPTARLACVNVKNQITRIVNNYARISFNFGPTLLSWLKENAPRTYRMILDGEGRSRQRNRGHSSAMAQVYNHMILPLANARDRATQIRWGIADYQNSFGAPPEGMWLPETAADTATLEALAANGIRFTVLAPHQCKRIRPLKDGDGEHWIDTPDATVDTTHPYLVRFASGASIAVFFYNGPVSRAIAFEGLLDSGDNLVARLKAGFKDSAQPQLVHVATDGESYGHHHKYGEMALAYALRLLEQDKTVKLTNYAASLSSFRRSSSARLSKTLRGAACMAWSAGAPTAAATAAARLEPGVARAAAPGS